MTRPWKKQVKRHDFHRTVYLPSPRDAQFAFKTLAPWLPLGLAVLLAAMGMFRGREAPWQQGSGRREKVELGAAASFTTAILPFAHLLLPAG